MKKKKKNAITWMNTEPSLRVWVLPIARDGHLRLNTLIKCQQTNKWAREKYATEVKTLTGTNRICLSA